MPQKIQPIRSRESRYIFCATNGLYSRELPDWLRGLFFPPQTGSVSGLFVVSFAAARAGVTQRSPRVGTGSVA